MTKTNVVAIVRTFVYLPWKSESLVRNRKIELNQDIVILLGSCVLYVLFTLSTCYLKYLGVMNCIY